MASHTDGYICILHIVNTFRVTHLHTQLMKIFLKKCKGDPKSCTLSRTSETRNPCVIEVILLACSTYIDIFKFIKSLHVKPCLSKNLKYTFYTIKRSLTLAYYMCQLSFNAAIAILKIHLINHSSFDI
jgi:hypothetical protein